MPAQDPEILTMSRCRRLIEPLPVAARQRVVAYLMSLAGDMPAPKGKTDPRQATLPNVESGTPFDGQ
jgi:hypothetical protein